MGGTNDNADVFFADRSGLVWIGFHGNTIASVDGDKVRMFTAKDGIAVGDVQAIQRHGSDIWIGGEMGVEVFDGKRFVPLYPAEEHALNGVRSLLGPEHEGYG